MTAKDKAAPSPDLLGKGEEIAALPPKARAHRLPDVIRAIAKAVAK